MALRMAARRLASSGRAFALVCALGTAAGTASAQTQPEPSAPAPARAQACATCHGTPERAPQVRTPSLAGQQRDFLELQMFLFREGLRDVPQMAGMFKGVSDTELVVMAKYFASQKTLSPPAGKPDPKLHARGASLSASIGCGSCHMSDYRGQNQVPRIANQREDYLVTALKDYRDNRRSGTDTSMNSVLYQVSDADIQALAHYLAHYSR